MLTEWASSFQREFGNAASYCVLLVFLSTVPFCVHKQRWPEIGAIALLLLTSAGALSGFKVILLTLLLPLAQLGSLADDKPALILGGVAMVVLSLREAAANWRKITAI
jgi:hypothetical protein